MLETGQILLVNTGEQIQGKGKFLFLILYIPHLIPFHFARKYTDYRTRKDRTERRNQCFATQLKPMTDAYMAWYGALGQDGLGGGMPEEYEGEMNSQTVITVDIFRAWLF